ncbi:MAG TPA: hypothetical protein VKX29_06125 [Brumimicrobium sp.]|nr:hypothetical protein [Brumimicrobium sp.]
MKTIISILFTTLAVAVFSQLSLRTVDDILEQPEKKAGIYRIAGTYLNTAVVNMNYGSAEILSVMNKKELKDADIIQIDVVYTNYPRDQDISDLNKQRILNMLSIRPDLIKSSGITWSMVRQMYCRNESQAKLLFHGVVIYYQPEQTQALNRLERESYEALPQDDKIKITDNTLKQFNDEPVILKVMERNNWKNPTIVADVTCSMYPYMKQTAFWFLLKMNKKETVNITLFNDGDGISNDQKIVGRTGGLHSVSTKDYKDFRELLLKSVSYGCSGDSDENDVEAIYKAQRDNPDAKEIILIADNLSNMRDYSLIPKIKVPVRIILCGTKYRINLQYLNLARMTGGSVHSIEEDLTDLINKSEGESFKFLDKTYVISDGQVIERVQSSARI